MDSHARCWLVVASVSPLAAAFSLWTLVTLHAYRRQWRTVDVLFVAAISQEFLHSLFLLGHSVLNLTQPNIIPLCSLFLWATVSIRTFQLATLTTLALDRAFTLVWPYRYRLTVRRHQVRYHLVAMAIVSSLVGVASVFAQNSPPQQPVYTCFLLPFDTDPEFAIFLATLHALLCLVSFGGLIYVQLKLCLTPKTLYCSPSSTITTTSTAAGVDRIRIPNKPYLIMDNNGGSGSERGRQWMMNSSLRKESLKDFRWGAVLPIIITCQLVNHLPYLVMVTLARFTTWVPPLWLEGGSAYLALVQALLLPALLWGIDPIYKTAVTHTLVRNKQGKKDDATLGYAENAVSRVVGRQQGSVLAGSLNFDTALAYSTFVCSSDTLDKKELLLMQSNEGSRWGTATKDDLNVLTSFYHPQMTGDKNYDMDKPRSSRSPEPVYCDPAEMIPHSDQSKDCGISSAVEDHIYATVSDRYDRSTLSVKGVSRRLTEEDNFDVDDDDDNSSATTSASDDFEFHLTRPHFVTHDDVPNRLRCSVLNHNVKSGANSTKHPSMDLQPSATPSRTSTLSIRSNDAVELSNGGSTVMVAGNHSKCFVSNDDVNKLDCLMLKQKNTSLSMNDLDLLSIKTEESTEELVYVLTGKSESNLSLYKITNCEDLETLDRPLFRYNAKRAPTLVKVNPPQLNSSSRYSTWSLQEPDSQLEWEVSTSKLEPVKHSVITSTLDPLVPQNMQTSPKKHASNACFQKHYCRNPFLVKNRIRTNGGKMKACCGGSSGIYSSTNWKYRANNNDGGGVLVPHRQDFPWKSKGRGSGTKLFPTSVALPYQFPSVNKRYLSLNNAGNCNGLAANNSLSTCRESHPKTEIEGMSYQRKFISDFL